MTWHGRVFPRCAEDGVETPEALPALDGVLPHLHADHEDRFPVAVACAKLDDKDPDDSDYLEENGRKIGRELGASCGEKLAKKDVD